VADSPVQEVALAMYALIRECHGKRNLKPLDLTHAMTERFGPEICTRETGKLAIRELIESGRCIYAYQGGSYIVLSPDTIPEDGQTR
jgi:hypothetical protein